MDTFQFTLSVLDSTGVRLFIICISVIAILALFRERLLGCSDKPSQPKHIHTYYISGILLLLLIQLGSYIAVVSDPKGETLMQYISFAATLSSLILSILAIIYTMVSNSKGDTHVAKLESASTKLTTSADEFAKQIKSLETIASSIHEFKSVASKLKDDLRDAIEQKIEEMGYNLQKTQYEHIQQIKGNGDVNSDLNKRTNGLPPFKEYLERGSLLGGFSIYVLLLAKKRGVLRVPFNLFVANSSSDYCYGYLIATAAVYSLGLSIEVPDEGKLDILVQNITLDFQPDTCKEILKQKINALPEAHEAQKEFWNNELLEVEDKIENLFKQN